MQEPEEVSVVNTLDLGMVRSFLLRGKKRHVLVDTGIQGSEGKILDMLAGLGIDPRDISLIILTHEHADHIGSAAKLKEATGALIAMHLLDAEAGRTGKLTPTNPLNGKGRLMNALFRLLRLLPNRLQTFDPDILIGGEMPLSEFGVGGKVIPTPGHTPGSLSILLDSGEAIVGDLVGGRKKPKYSPFGESVEAMRASIEMVLEERPRVLFAAHGGPFTPEEVRRAFF